MDKVIKLERIYNGNLEIKAGVKYDCSELEEITGYCYIYSNVELPKLTTIGGSCDIYSNVEFKAPKLTTIGGYCDIYSNVELPKLTTIGGYCDIYSNVELPKLTTIGGSCYIYSNVELPKLTTIGGSCYIYSNVEFKAPKLTTIGGYCDIYSNTKFKAPKLTTIGGYCYIYSNVEFKAPNLTTIGGSCYIYSNVELPKLTTIGGYCYIHSNTKFKAHKNLKKNDKNAKEYCRQFTFNVFFKLGFFFTDNILAKFISSKTNKNGSKVHKVQIIGQTKLSYCIEVDGVFSHGDTLKEAKESLIYKISNRDKSMYEDYTLDSVVTFEDAVKMYRVITGACEAGTRNFVQGLAKRKKKYTVAEIITATQGQYGNETFKEFFNG